eukprot:c14646_g1_i2.p1 GENE.c14646_g1_i2~~c14646_g1_i2.p1  ORF type:complete len:134 (+),score=47.15 c14646_g1_i2:128-529(+)
MSKIYYRGAGAAIICFDLTNAETWRKVRFWVDEILKHEQECKIFIVGTKGDLLDNSAFQAVSLSEIEPFCHSIGSQGYFQTSAKSNIGVNELFECVASTYQQKTGIKHQPLVDPVNIRKQSPSLLSSCCFVSK